MRTEDEFDDVIRMGLLVGSRKARGAMTALAAVHGLTFTHNPGGGEFGKAGWRCQIGCNDDLADLAKLRTALSQEIK